MTLFEDDRCYTSHSKDAVKTELTANDDTKSVHYHSVNPLVLGRYLQESEGLAVVPLQAGQTDDHFLKSVPKNRKSDDGSDQCNLMRCHLDAR